jgi:hypothetical protein
MVALLVSLFLLGALFLNRFWMEVACGGAVYIYHVEVDESHRHGGAEYWW